MSAFRPSSACGRGCLPRPGTVSRAAWPTRAARLTALLAMLVAAVGLALCLPALGSARRGRAIRGWFRGMLRAVGVTLVVHGDPPPSGGGPSRPGMLVAANHMSWLDIPAVLAVVPVRVLAKSEVRAWPVVGLLAARAGTIFIDRARPRRLPGTVAEIAGQLRAGQDVLVFPEGSTWCGRTMGRFYPATLQAALDAGAEVRPVALRYRIGATRTTAAAFVGDDTLVASAMRVLATRGLTVEVTVAPGLSTVDEMAGIEGRPAPAYRRRALAVRTAAVIKGDPDPARADPPGPVVETAGCLATAGRREP
jgi:1-acyl-sn-glycerol-3-phosphate acyltransferase